MTVTWLEFLSLMVRAYLLMGGVVIFFEWVCCAIAQGSAWASDKAKERIIETLAYAFEVIIWPRQLVLMIDSAKKLLSSPQWQDYMEHLNEEDP